MARGFQDLRTAAQLLVSARMPQKIKVRTQNLLRGKFLGKVQRIQGLLKKASSAATRATGAVGGAIGGAVGGPAGQLVGQAIGEQIGKYALRGASVKAFATASRLVNNAMSGKVAAMGKNGLGSVNKLATSISLGVSIIEEMNPNKLRKPWTEGLSVAAAQAGKQLAETAAKGVLQGLIAGALGKGVPPLSKIFKTQDEIQKSVRFFDITKSRAGTLGQEVAQPVAPVSTTPKSALINQHGLLQDEIFYRLVLLAENIYTPFNLMSENLGFGSIVILEGFRSESSGTSPHERGEAVDLTIGDGSLSQAERLYQLALWAKDHLVFDQMILCHSLIPRGPGQAWLHITFSPEQRRRVVLTKTLNDEFEEGLFVYTDYTGNGRSAAAAALADDARLASEYINRISGRALALNPVGVNTAEGFMGEFKDGETCFSYIDPWGTTYSKSTIESLYKGAVASAFDSVKESRPELWEKVKEDTDRRQQTEFLYEVVRAVNDPKVGIVGVRGNCNDPSLDAIAILHPTGGPQGTGPDKWDADRRICVIDVIGGAQSDGASFAWIDHTCPQETATDACFISV